MLDGEQLRLDNDPAMSRMRLDRKQGEMLDGEQKRQDKSLAVSRMRLDIDKKQEML
jgi:hypothetical protein